MMFKGLLNTTSSLSSTTIKTSRQKPHPQDRPSILPHPITKTTTTMTPPPATQSSSTFALTICLAIIVIPPILAAVLSAINALAKGYGKALLNLLDAICTIIAYLAQFAMIVSALCCAYFGLDAVSIELDPAVPRIVAPAFFALVSFSLALGFVVFAIGGLYIVEYTVWSSAMKSPTELAIVVMMKTLIDAAVECE